MRITITCEDCGRRHRLERAFDAAGPIWIVCHACETPLTAELDADQVGSSTPVLIDSAFVGAWGGVLDVTPIGSLRSA